MLCRLRVAILFFPYSFFVFIISVSFALSSCLVSFVSCFHFILWTIQPLLVKHASFSISDNCLSLYSCCFPSISMATLFGNAKSINHFPIFFSRSNSILNSFNISIVIFSGKDEFNLERDCQPLCVPFSTRCFRPSTIDSLYSGFDQLALAEQDCEQYFCLANLVLNSTKQN